MTHSVESCPACGLVAVCQQLDAQAVRLADELLGGLPDVPAGWLGRLLYCPQCHTFSLIAQLRLNVPADIAARLRAALKRRKP